MKERMCGKMSFSMDFYLPKDVDADAEAKAKEALRAHYEETDQFEVQYVDKYGFVDSLPTSSWRMFSTNICMMANAKEVKPDDGDDDGYFSSPDYEFDVDKLICLGDMSGVLESGDIGKSIAYANDHFDGEWGVASPSCGVLGFCAPVSDYAAAVAATSEKVDDLVYLDDGDNEVKSVWDKLAREIVGSDESATFTYGECVEKVSTALQSIHAYEVDARDCVLVTPKLADDAINEMRTIARAGGIDEGAANELFDFFTYNGWCIGSLSSFSKTMQIVKECGIDKLRCVMG